MWRFLFQLLIERWRNFLCVVGIATAKRFVLTIEDSLLLLCISRLLFSHHAMLMNLSNINWVITNVTSSFSTYFSDLIDCEHKTNINYHTKATRKQAHIMQLKAYDFLMLSLVAAICTSSARTIHHNTTLFVHFNNMTNDKTWVQLFPNNVPFNKTDFYLCFLIYGRHKTGLKLWAIKLRKVFSRCNLCKSFDNCC